MTDTETQSPTSERRKPTEDHLAALAQGRKESAIVSSYLEALDTNKPKRGRRRTADSIGARLAAIEDEMATASAITRLSLAQERIDLQHERLTMDMTFDMKELEDAFVEVVAGYSERKGLSYRVWREVGVSSAVLRRAGIAATRLT
jgi:hypothetical protein